MANFNANSFQFKQLKATSKMLRQSAPSGYAAADTDSQAFAELTRAQNLLGAYITR